MAQHLLFVILMSLIPPKLTVNPAVIRETDAVKLNCQTPSFVAEVRCEFFTSTGQTLGDSSCLQTITGTDLLKMNHQHPPVYVKVTCFYKLGKGKSPSLHSETLSIFIHSPPPNLTASPSVITEMDSVTLNCQTPSYVSVDQCFFYFVKGKPAQRFSCLKTLTGAELLTFTNQNAPAEVEVTCSYLVTYESPESPMSYITIQTLLPPNLTFRGGQYQSPHSNVSSITITSKDERKPRTTESMQTFTVVTDIKPSTMESMREETMAKGDFMSMRNIDQEALLPAGNNGYSVITSVPAAECHTALDLSCVILHGFLLLVDSEKLKDKDSQNGESDTYHMYATIPEEPAASVLKNPMYSTLQAH
ncbi:hypothetical protein Q5P01_001626 [Channa striata]|uniref:Uncharacterized protein n=1 Tax=Channa striata TaxID=64152 RepID=A0AA88NRT0_CHASR|nr:hypothetical protein Q5P01_001626 [Channa striata]